MPEQTMQSTEQTILRPDGCTDQHLEFLDKLRDSGVTNMFSAAPYLRKKFNKQFRGNTPEERKAKEKLPAKIVVYWMRTFDQRHP